MALGVPPPLAGSVGKDVGPPQRINAGPKSKSEVEAKGKTQSQTSKAESESKAKNEVNVKVESRGQKPKSKSHSEPTANATGAIGGMLEICGKLQKHCRNCAIFCNFPQISNMAKRALERARQDACGTLTSTFDCDFRLRR